MEVIEGPLLSDPRGICASRVLCTAPVRSQGTVRGFLSRLTEGAAGCACSFPILTATTDVALRKIGSHTAGNGDLLEGIVEAGEAFGTSSASAREFTGAYLCKGLVQPRIFSVDVAGSTGGRASQEPNSPIAVQLSGKSEAQRSPNCRPQPMEDIIFPASSPGFDVKPVPCRINVDRERRTPTPSDPTAGQCHSGEAWKRWSPGHWSL